MPSWVNLSGRESLAGMGLVNYAWMEAEFCEWERASSNAPPAGNQLIIGFGLEWYAGDARA